MNKSQARLKKVSQGLINMFTNMVNFLSGKIQESQENRSKKGRVLFRRALDPQDKGVSFWYDKREGLLRTRLRVESSETSHKGEPFVRWTEIREDGFHQCSCPDHKGKGAFCKHLRALSGLTVKQTRKLS